MRVALDCGLNFIDTSPFYGRGMSEVLLGDRAARRAARQLHALHQARADTTSPHFDFSAQRVAESVDVSLHRLGTDHLDIMLCHDIEFVPMQQIVDETLPALRRAQQTGKVRFIGFSGYPMKIFRYICDQTDVDCVLSYNQYTLQNTRFADEVVPYLKQKGIGIMNAGPFSARLLTNAPLPAWLKEPDEVKAAARKAAELCARRGADIAKLAVQFSLANPDITTTIAGSANPDNIRKWAAWAAAANRCSSLLARSAGDLRPSPERRPRRRPAGEQLSHSKNQRPSRTIYRGRLQNRRGLTFNPDRRDTWRNCGRLPVVV